MNEQEQYYISVLRVQILWGRNFLQLDNVVISIIWLPDITHRLESSMMDRSYSF